MDSFIRLLTFAIYIFSSTCAPFFLLLPACLPLTLFSFSNRTPDHGSLEFPPHLYLSPSMTSPRKSSSLTSTTTPSPVPAPHPALSRPVRCATRLVGGWRLRSETLSGMGFRSSWWSRSLEGGSGRFQSWRSMASHEKRRGSSRRGRCVIFLVLSPIFTDCSRHCSGTKPSSCKLSIKSCPKSLAPVFPVSSARSVLVRSSSLTRALFTFKPSFGPFPLFFLSPLKC
jgi:hypothetical protein